MKRYHLTGIIIFLFILPGLSQKYQSFRVSIYCTAYDVSQMSDTVNFLLPRWNEISRQLKVDKIYLETHRDLLVVEQQTLDIARKFFENRGYKLQAVSLIPSKNLTISRLFVTMIRGTGKKSGKLQNILQKTSMNSYWMISSLRAVSPTELSKTKAAEAGHNIVWT